MNEHQKALRRRVETAPEQDPPAGWQLVSRSPIGGLTAVGFGADERWLLVTEGY